MAQKVYPKGIHTFAKRENAPSFVLGDLNIMVDELLAFCDENPEYLTEYKGKRQLKCQMTTNDEGRVVISVNTYGLTSGANQASKQSPAKQEPESDLPF